MANAMNGRKKNKKNAAEIAFAKRFDQGLNNIFRSLPAEQQESNDITPSALRNIMKNIKEPENKEVLDEFMKKYNSKRHWARFLANFIN